MRSRASIHKRTGRIQAAMNRLRSLPARVAALLFASLLMIAGSPVLAQSADDPTMQPAVALLEQGRTARSAQTLTEARNGFSKLIEQHPDNARYFYERALTGSYLADAYAGQGDKKNAGKALDDAINDAQESLKLNEPSADTHSLLADLYGHKIGLGTTMFAGPRFGPKVQSENKRALEIDANNPRVYASLGRQYLEAPKQFGGDLDKAIANFRKSTELDPKSDETWVWLSIALRRKNQQKDADYALNQALQLNPQSAFAKQTAQGK